MTGVPGHEGAMDFLEHDPLALANEINWIDTSNMSLSLQTESDLNFLREPSTDGLLSNEFNVDPMIEMPDWAQYGISSSVMELMPNLPRDEDFIDIKKDLDLSIVQEIIDSDTTPSTSTVLSSSPSTSQTFMDIPQPLSINGDDDIKFDLPTFLEADNDAEFMQLIASNEVATPQLIDNSFPTIKEPVEEKVKIQENKVSQTNTNGSAVSSNRRTTKRRAAKRLPQIKPERKPPNRNPNKKSSGSIGKKLDVQRRCYVYEGDIKKEIVTDNSESSSSSDTSDDEFSTLLSKGKKSTSNNIYTDSEVSDVDIETVSDGEGQSTILKAKDVNSLLDKFEAETETTYTERSNKNKVHSTTQKSSSTNNFSKKVNNATNQKHHKRPSVETIKNKDIPQELLQRMRENSKRKVVPVIEAIPNKKGKSRLIKTEKVEQKSTETSTKINDISPEESLKDYMDRGYPKYIIAQIRVAIDHSYCSFEKKDNIDSHEEEEDIPVKKEPVDPTLAILPKTETNIKQEQSSLPRTGVGQENNNINIANKIPSLDKNKLIQGSVVNKVTSRNLNGKVQPVKVQQVQGTFQNINGKIEQVSIKSGMSPSKNVCNIKVESNNIKKETNSICSQPLVKNADGKLMVSLLKSNTIHTTSNTSTANVTSVQRKKKLNLEEYKKRRDIVFVSNGNGSTGNSTNTSPKHITDQSEYLKNLSKMANEVLQCKKGSKLRTPSLPDIDVVSPKIKSEKSSEPITQSAPTSPLQSEASEPEIKNRATVNFGTNTEESWLDHDRLNEIKPIIENASVKIGSNSLLASMIQTVCRKKVNPLPELKPEENVHWEDKVVYCVESNRTPNTTRDVYVQTDSSWCLDHLINNRFDSSFDDEDISASSSRRSRSTSRSRSSRSPSSRSPSPVRRKRRRSRSRSLDRERINEIEERRVIYIGKLTPRTTKEDLRRRFESFGIITNVSVHHRSKNDSYGFVTYKYKQDAYDAVEHGNDDPNYPKVDLSFGGRRIFCKTNYSDLDNVHESDGYGPWESHQDVPFDYLLNDFKKLRNRLP